MKTEISRDSHQPDKRYSGVYQQQGRMLTDADWNELVDILKQRLNDALKDVVGCKNGSIGGVPRHRALSILSVEPTGPVIQPGYVYIDGVSAQVPGETSCLYLEQPDFPAALATPAANYYLYADVWERTVTPLMDERLLDKGLHGADTCTRKQTMAQIKWCLNSIDPEQSGLNPGQGNAGLSLRLLTKITQLDPCDPCADTVEVDAKVGNFLFRVEVHDVKGDANRPAEITFKWSSENGAAQFIAKPKTNMPAGFVDNKYVYEFFSETSEKHLGVHLTSNASFPVRLNLFELYPDTNPAGFDFVRRWDGYATYQWDASDKSWKLLAGISGSTQVVQDGSSTRSDKVLKLDAIELKLQLLSRVISDSVTANVLAAGHLTINNTAIAPLAIIADTVSSKNNAASAITKAAAINRAFDSVTNDAKVWATANPARVEGVTPVVFSGLASGNLKINGVSIDAVSGSDNLSAQLDGIKNAINRAFPAKEIVATKTTFDTILVSAEDGRNIDIELTGANTAQQCGLSAGTFYSSITLASRSSIEIKGSHADIAGLKKGVTASLKTVAGDFWLADVREAEHQAGSVLIQNKLPQGIAHHYLTLGEVDHAGQLLTNPEADRKYAFPPLTELTRMFRVRGNGQEAMPGESLAQPLVVGVVNGEWPVAGSMVAFELEEGNGSISSSGGIPFAPNALVVKTNEFGLALCDWDLGPLNSGAQRVVARLLDPDSKPPGSVSFISHPAIYFNASLSTAEQIAYASDCASSMQDTVHHLLTDDTPAALQHINPDYYNVKEVLDALLCKLRAKHVPYNPNQSAATTERWRDIREQPTGDLTEPNTVQEAIDELINIDATDIAVDRDKLCARLEVLGGAEKVETVQDAINALCKTSQGGGCCEIIISEGDDLEAKLASELKQNADAHICIASGVYIVKKPVLLEDLGHITIQGCGNATVIRTTDGEVAMQLSRCKSVAVSHLTMQSYKLGNEKQPDDQHLNGVLTINDVTDVVVENVSLSCPHGGLKMATCLTVAQSDVQNISETSVRINSCQLHPGHQQVGMLLINTNLARVEDNEVNVRPKTKSLSLKTLLKDKYYLLTIRKIMLSSVIVVDEGTRTDRKRNVEFAYEGRLLRFQAQSSLENAWQAYVKDLDLKKGLNNRDVIRYLKDHVDKILLALANEKVKAAHAITVFQDWFDKMKSDLPAIASQGIVCAGRIANDICITRNAIHGVAQGIHIGLSHDDADNKEPYIAGRLLITGNRISNYQSSQNLGEWHGVFVGNVECLHIENNYLALKKFPNNLDSSINGIRVFGYFGGMIQLRGNSVNGYGTGIFAKAINVKEEDVHLWQVENNLMKGSTVNPVLDPQWAFIADNNPH